MAQIAGQLISLKNKTEKLVIKILRLSDVWEVDYT